MKTRTDRSRSRLALGVILLTALIASSCSLTSDPTSRYADNATVEVTGTSTGPLYLISSTKWGIAVDELTFEQRVVLEEADTTEIQLPFQQTVPLRPTYRIYFAVGKPGSDLEANIRMQVRLDKKLVYDESIELTDAPIEYSFFYW